MQQLFSKKSLLNVLNATKCEKGGITNHWILWRNVYILLGSSKITCIYVSIHVLESSGLSLCQSLLHFCTSNRSHPCILHTLVVSHILGSSYCSVVAAEWGNNDSFLLELSFHQNIFLDPITS